jgi:hypothetical protein
MDSFMNSSRSTNPFLSSLSPGGSNFASASNNPFVQSKQQSNLPRNFPIMTTSSSHAPDISSSETKKSLADILKTKNTSDSGLRQQHTPSLSRQQNQEDVILTLSIENVRTILTEGDNSIVSRLNTIERMLVELNKNMSKLQTTSSMSEANEFVTEDYVKNLLQMTLNEFKKEIEDLIEKRLSHLNITGLDQDTQNE